MQKVSTDVHTHSAFSFDGEVALEKMLAAALEKGISYYGVSEHFDYDQILLLKFKDKPQVCVEEYFHKARHLQEDYAGCMNVLVGGEFGYSRDPRVHKMYKEVAEKYRPDFIVNSMHTLDGEDYSDGTVFYAYNEKGEKILRDRVEVFREYFTRVRESLDVEYPYDIIGHMTYAARYSPYEEKGLPMQELWPQIEDILRTMIKKGKILEVNSSTDGLCIPDTQIVRRYYELGGRQISFASDAHTIERIGAKREEVVAALKEIGFTYITVPMCGEYVKVEI